MLSYKSISPVAAVVVWVLAGCATDNIKDQPTKPGHGIVEYNKIAEGAKNAVLETLKTLDRATTYTNGVPSRFRSSFVKQVERLEIDSVQVRARSQAILARGDDYFKNWQTNLEHIENPAVRDLAREHRPQLESSFNIMKSSSQQVRKDFQPFLAGLRKLRTALENDPQAMATESNQELTRVTADKGRQVLDELAGIQNEL